MKCTNYRLLVLALAIFCSLTTVASAAPITMIIDSTQSYAVMSGDILGVAIANGKNANTNLDAGPGSLIDYYSGTLAADFTGGTLTFTGGSVITGLLNPAGPFQKNSIKGTDNYGVSGGTLAAFRNLSYDIDAGTATDGSPASGMNLLITTGFINSFAGDGPLAGGNGANSSLSNVSLTQVGNLLTLILPTRRETGNVGALHIITTGQIVATATVPEPSTCLLFGCGLLGMLVFAKRRAGK